MSNLHKIYKDICRGYSTVKWDNKDIFIKHLNHFDQGEIDEYYETQVTAAIKGGISTKKQKSEWLKENKLWSDEEEINLIQQKDYIENMEKTKNRLILKTQIDQYTKILKEEWKKYYEMVEKREKLFGLTAEYRASQKVQYFHILISFYKNEDLKDRLFTLKNINQLDDDESLELLNSYVNSISQFDAKTIKKISISDFFLNYFYLCGDNIFNFFHIPIYKLTIYQSNLLSYGTYYKNLISNEQIPENFRDDPDRIEEFVNKSRNMKELLSKTGGQGGSTGIVGATKEDFAALGIKENRGMMKEAMEKGVTNITDAVKLAGK